ncbi:MAG: polysaccharide deacetylase family protein, partial [Cyanobacteria bacterium J06600_6]
GRGNIVISLDLELYWGMRDIVSINDYQQHLAGVRQAIPAILELFKRYNIHATWATVGFLFHANLEQLKANLPQQQPNYQDSKLSPYKYIQTPDAEENQELHFCPDLLELIKQYSGQEIGTHTFSHYYCLERGQNKAEFKADLMAAIESAKLTNTTTNSLVFPRNQYNQSYLETVADCGISSYRGNETSSIYNDEAGDGDRLPKRMLRLLDAYFNLTGHNCYSRSQLSSSYPVNIPASRFLRPYSPRLKYLDPLRLRRITSGLKYAARQGQTYHLWWHPHNFGVNLTENLSFLENILQTYQKLNAQNKMQSLNMQEIAELVMSSQAKMTIAN